MNQPLIQSLMLHRVGNKAQDEGFFLSETLLPVDSDLEAVLNAYFLKPFSGESYFRFHHDASLDLNEAYRFISEIFNDPDTLPDCSKKLARHLYNESSHPKIKGGEFYVVYFKNGSYKGDSVDMIGLFKSENKDTFLKIYPQGEGFVVGSETGININRLDKGCLIFNTEADDGYVVAVVNQTNKGAEARYWIDEFLGLRQKQDAYFHTENTMALYKEFIEEKLPETFELTKLDQGELLTKSMTYFKEKDQCDIDELNDMLFSQPEVVDSFHDFRQTYQQERDLGFVSRFDIAGDAVKRKQRYFKSVIKLDKNFHIYIHGDRSQIEQDVDATGRKFYRLFYENEA